MHEYVHTSTKASLNLYMCINLTDPVTWKQLQQRFNRVSSGLQNVLDEREYQKHSQFLSEKANLSVTLNTDGTDVFHSSTASLYPVWMTINKLPPLVR